MSGIIYGVEVVSCYLSMLVDVLRTRRSTGIRMSAENEVRSSLFFVDWTTLSPSYPFTVAVYIYVKYGWRKWLGVGPVPVGFAR